MTKEPATIPADLASDTRRRREPQSRSVTGAPSRVQLGHSADREVGEIPGSSASGRCRSEVRILSRTAQFGTIRCPLLRQRFFLAVDLRRIVPVG